MKKEKFKILVELFSDIFFVTVLIVLTIIGVNKVFPMLQNTEVVDSHDYKCKMAVSCQCDNTKNCNCTYCPDNNCLKMESIKCKK